VSSGKFQPTSPSIATFMVIAQAGWFSLLASDADTGAPFQTPGGWPRTVGDHRGALGLKHRENTVRLFNTAADVDLEVWQSSAW